MKPSIGSSPSEPARAGGSDGPLVLIVEDDDSTGLAIETVLGDEGYRVTRRESGILGLSAAVDLRPDVIVLDIRLPDMEGWTILRQLKSWPDTGHTPVIVVSAESYRVTPEERRLAAAIVAKPFEIDDLVAAVRQAARKNPRSG